MKKIIIILFLSLLSYSILIAAGRRVIVDSVKINSDHLFLDFHAEGIVDDKIVEGLRKGRTSTLEYKIQLWSKKSGLISQLVKEQVIRMKINYDFWENKYLILTPEEKRLTSSIETVRENCTGITNHKITSIKELQSDVNYSISVEVILKPLSVENYQEIRNWLSGEVKDISIKNLTDQEKQEKSIKNRLLRIFMIITGFGERVISCKTKQFKLENNQIMWQ